MELTWLRNFLSVARTRSFSASAREGNITQPAFSRRIKTLEHWAGVRLIDRSTYPTRLTPAGERFLDIAREIDDRLLDFRAQLAEERRSGANSLTIAVQHTLAFHHLPPVLADLRKARPEARVDLRANNIHDCIELLQEGSADLLVSFFVSNAPIIVDERRIEHAVLGTDVLVPVSAPDSDGHPQYTLPGTRKNETPWLSYGQEAMLDRGLSLMMDERGPFHLRSVLENPISEILRRMTLHGIGIAWLPESLIFEDLRSGRLVPIGGPEHRIAMEIRGYLPVDSQSEIADAFLRIAREHIAAKNYARNA